MVDDQCRQKGMRLRTVHKGMGLMTRAERLWTRLKTNEEKRDEVEDLCGEKGAGLMTNAENTGRG